MNTLKLGNFIIGSVSGSSMAVRNFKAVPIDIDGEDITYAHITWTASSKYETEIWRSLDGGAFALLTTIGLNIGQYDDHLFDGNEHTADYYLRFKQDLTVLNIPTNLTLAAIDNGIRVTWQDNNTEAEYIEIWSSVDSAAYSLVTTVQAGVETYDNTISFNVDVKYKIRAKEGTLPVYSDYTAVSTITLSSIALAILNDGNTFAWWDASDLTTITKNGSNLVSDWNDKLGSGNNLVQAVDTNKPLWAATGITFDGSDNKMDTGAKTLNQPVMCYLAHKQITWTNTDVIFSGQTENAFYQQYGSGTALRIYGGTTSATLSSSLINTYKVDRLMFNGASSYIRENAGTKGTASIGTASFGGFKIAERASYYGNIEVKDCIVRKVADSDATSDIIYRYLKQKNSI